MKKVLKYFIIVLMIIVILFVAFFSYKIIKKQLVIKEKKEVVEKDETEYGEKYEKFSSEVYKEKPIRIIFKKENTINEFYIFDNKNKDYERILKVAEDRMYYSSMQDFNLWSFTPYTLGDISKSNENFIVFDYDDNIENKDYIYDWDFNRDIFFRFSNSTRLYRLLDYLSCIIEPINSDEIKNIIGKNDFIPKEQIISGYKYMNPFLLSD